MIGVLKFKLPDEREEFELAQNGARYEIAISEFQNWIRSELKYNDKLSVTKRDSLNQVQEKLCDFLRNNGLGE